MTSNEFSLDSSSDSEVSEIEDYEIEVEGLPNSSDHADEYDADEETQGGRAWWGKQKRRFHLFSASDTKLPRTGSSVG